MKLMKLDAFTIFLILLGLLVVIALFMNIKDNFQKETFVDFQNHPLATGTAVYIPQYNSTPSRKVLSLYDNIYFDKTNGAIIEVFAPNCQTNCDTTGKNITDISVASRDGLEITAVPTILDNTGNVRPNTTTQSLITSLSQLYKQYVYTTSSKNTHIYQVFYTSWYDNTYIHIVDLNENDITGTNVKSIFINSTGVKSSQSSFNTPSLQPYKSAPSNIIANTSEILPSIPDQKYLNNSIPLLQLGKNENSSVSYDISSGNIVVNSSNVYTIYNRDGNSINNPEPNNIWKPISNINTFTINDISGLSILVTSYNDETLINMIVPHNNNSYKLLYSYRFNKSGFIYNIQTDTGNNPELITTPPQTTSPQTTSPQTTSPQTTSPQTTSPQTTSPQTTLSNTASHTHIPADSNLLESHPLPTMSSLNTNNNVTNITNSSVCGDDLSCKWYWYFNTINQKHGSGTDSTYFSDDYFLKTEAVPPVCPQCPQCPSIGSCNNCGGEGGSGTVGATSSGPLQTNRPITTNGPTTTNGPPGSLTSVALGVTDLGASGVNTVGSVANNLIDTTGGAVGSVTNLAGKVIDSTTGLVGGLTSTVGNLAGDIVNTSGELAGNVVNTSGNLIGSLGRVQGQGQMQTSGQGQIQTSGQGQIQTSGQGPNNNDLYRPGYSPIDNYSQYGALESKGGEFIPVTADFSSFRK
jgi:hypothetical protein